MADLPRSVALLLTALMCGACSRAVHPLTLEARWVDDATALELSIEGHDGGLTMVFAGSPWGPLEPLVEDMGGLLVSSDEPRPLVRQKVPAGRPVVARLSAAELDALPLPCVLQAAVATAGNPPVVEATSRALVLVHSAAGRALVSFSEYLGQGLGFEPLATLSLAAAVVLGLVACRWPRRLSGRPGAALLGLALVAVLVERAVGGDAARDDVDLSYAAPALLGLGDRELAGDHYERSLGPGFRALVDAAWEQRVGDEPLVVWTRPRGEGFTRAVHLAALTGAELQRWSRKYATPAGLVIFCDVPSQGTILFASPAGELARIGSAR